MGNNLKMWRELHLRGDLLLVYQVEGDALILMLTQPSLQQVGGQQPLVPYFIRARAPGIRGGRSYEQPI